MNQEKKKKTLEIKIEKITHNLFPTKLWLQTAFWEAQKGTHLQKGHKAS